jgi:hypothetical protein
MELSRILVVLGEKQWTRRAMHLACAMARNQGAAVMVISTVPVANPQQLGNINYHPDHDLDYQKFVHDLIATAEDYQVPLETIQLHYASYINGISSAADELKAAAVFATLPKYRLKILANLQFWRLSRAIKCRLYTLDGAGESDWAESPPQSDLGRGLPEAHALLKH